MVKTQLQVVCDQILQGQDRLLERVVDLEKLLLLLHISKHGQESTFNWISQTDNLEAFSRNVRRWLKDHESECQESPEE